ncbi:MAG: pseudouridine synthase [Rhodospirillaceae bacterium]|nr:pseudouridine synthase [Rhodospirillaceae bacterium]|tara:strand:+ start:127 stop:885 length:759 start_codon:yes stop_codon:yes gene_type:complete
MDENKKDERVAKIIARAGLCSRREAERLILRGLVRVDGELITSPALNISAKAKIDVDGNPLPDPQPTRMWRYHKPAGRLTTRRDPEGRPTIYDGLPLELSQAITIGRLDMSSEGLLLLTNDGGLARRLELPKTGWLRKYRVRVHGIINSNELDQLAHGITIDGIHYGPVTATLERQIKSNAWVNIALREGKNREIRRLMEHLGYSVNRLIRISFGPFQLGKLTRGNVEELSSRILSSNLPSDINANATHNRR